MKSSEGAHFVGLDHVRALAAFLVVLWHFSHGNSGYPVAFNRSPEIGLFDEGHSGVSLFMTLSGYLFAKLINGRRVHLPAFIWNRALRLAPLLLLVLLVVGLRDHRSDPLSYAKIILGGVVLPQLPNGGWSITAETHFYLILPILLWAAAKWKNALLVVVAVSISARLLVFALGFDLQPLAYFTIIGRIDQFALGIFFFMRPPPPRVTLLLVSALILFYAWFDAKGGFYAYPDQLIWSLLPTLEGAGFGAAIAWYDARPLRHRFMNFIQKSGEYSYSIYLLHFFFVFAAARLVDQHIMRLDSIYKSLPWAMLFFVLMTGLGYISYRWIETPFLKWRKPYLDRPTILKAV